MQSSGKGTEARWRGGLGRFALIALLAVSVLPEGVKADQTGIASYNRSRDLLWNTIYRHGGEELYCGSSFQDRGTALNVEHVFPREWMRQFLRCSGAQCGSNPRFRRMEADLHNLWPSFIWANSRRGHLEFREIPGEDHVRPNCDFEVGRVQSAQQDVVEPRPAARGEIARAIFYMQQEYGVPARQGLQPVLLQWNRDDPPSATEKARNDLIASLQGNRNSFIDDPSLAEPGNNLAPLAGPAPSPLLATAASGTAALKIVTWNIGWLTERADHLRTHPAGAKVYQRTNADFARLRAYADTLNADVVALQEIDTEQAAARVFDPAKYDIVLTDESDFQRPGFAIRKGLRWTRNPDFAELDIWPDKERSLRRGADVTLEVRGTPVRMLSVHLKSRCADPNRWNAEHCPALEEQIPILAAWMDRRQMEKVPFIVLGDFNRQLPPDDGLWRQLDNGPTPLLRATAGQTSPCWKGAPWHHPEFIDHFVLGGGTEDWVVNGSLQVTTYKEGPKLKDALSDHCPVSLLLAKPPSN